MTSSNGTVMYAPLSKGTSVLFEDGDWRICRTGTGDESSIYHLCNDADGVHHWWHISSRDRCAYCATMVPDGVMGLWQLHNWDRP